MPKKSKYDLSIYAHLKVPKSMFKGLVKIYGKEDWPEAVRDMIKDHLEAAGVSIDG